MRPMRTAPRDRDIIVLGPKGWRRCYYLECDWLREEFMGLPGDPDIADCWRQVDGNSDIELNEARGWKPAAETCRS